MKPEIFKGLTETIQFHKNLANNYAAMFNDPLCGISKTQSERESWQLQSEWHIAERMKREVELDELVKKIG